MLTKAMTMLLFFPQQACHREPNVSTSSRVVFSLQADIEFDVNVSVRKVRANPLLTNSKMHTVYDFRCCFTQVPGVTLVFPNLFL